MAPFGRPMGPSALRGRQQDQGGLTNQFGDGGGGQTMTARGDLCHLHRVPPLFRYVGSTSVDDGAQVVRTSREVLLVKGYSLIGPFRVEIG